MSRVAVTRLDGSTGSTGNVPVVQSDGVVIWDNVGVDTETVRDIVGAVLTAGTNISIVVDDVGNIVTISATDTNTTDPEVVRDTMAAALVAGDGVTIIVDDVGNTITINSTSSGGEALLADDGSLTQLTNEAVDDYLFQG